MSFCQVPSDVQPTSRPGGGKGPVDLTSREDFSPLLLDLYLLITPLRGFRRQDSIVPSDEDRQL